MTHPRKLIGLTAVVWAGLAIGGVTKAAPFQLDPGDFAVLAGGQLETGNGVTVEGTIGGGTDVWLGNDTAVTGDAYAGHAFGAGNKVSVTGSTAAGHDADLGNNASVGGSLTALGDTYLGSKATVGGHAYTEGRLEMNNKAEVSGDARYGDSYWLHNNAEVGGTLSQSGASYDRWEAALPDAPTFSAAGGSEWHANNSTVHLTPGDFGAFQTGNNATVHLAPGTYNFRSIWLGNNTQIVADTASGDVIVNVVDDFDAGNNAILSRSGDDGWLSVHSGGSIWLGSHVVADAGFAAYTGDVETGSHVDVSGQVVAGDRVWLGHHSRVGGYAGQLDLGGSPVAGAQPIPEPASLAMVGLGALLIARRRRRTAGE